MGGFGTIWLPYETRCKTGRTSAKVRETKSHRNFSQRTHPIHPNGSYTDVLVRSYYWVHSVQFGCLTKLDAKRAELEQKFVPRSHVEHSQQTHPIHPIGQYTNVLVRSYYLGAFGTAWLPYETRCKTGQTSAKVRATKSRRIFSQRTHSIHHIGP